MNSLGYLIIKILLIISIIPLILLLLKVFSFGIKTIKKNLIYTSLVLFCPIFLIITLKTINTEKNTEEIEVEIKKIDSKQKAETIPNFSQLNPMYKFTREVIIENKLFNKNIDINKCLEKEVMKNQNITTILKEFNVSNKDIYNLDNILKTKNLFNFNKIKPKDKYSLIFDENKKLAYMSYELNKSSYLIIDFNDFSKSKIQNRPHVIKKHELSGIITSHLWQAVNDVVDSSLETEAVVSILADKIYPWTIRFTHLNPNDKFKIIYEAKYINDEFIKIENVFASVFNHKGEDYYAIPFKENSNQKYNDYFDQNGNNLRNFFLQAPVDFRRISSKYSKNRRHPVTGRVTPHFGTDFAAESGSPIFSTADGVVTAAQYKKYNGYYVKIRHNSTYETQYLHMQKKSVNYWKKNGISVGKKIKQGDIIGFVGQTGLATGPHVCYRFWKNGKQVDPFKENLPPSEPIKENNLNEFKLKKNKWIKELNKIEYPDYESIDFDA